MATDPKPVTCCVCDELFWLRPDTWEFYMRTRHTFYCPNGHGLTLTKPVAAIATAATSYVTYIIFDATTARPGLSTVQ
jgi:hypothetical protein